MQVKVSTLRFQIQKSRWFSTDKRFTNYKGKVLSHAWYVYEFTHSQYLCFDSHGRLFLSPTTGYQWNKEDEQAVYRLERKTFTSLLSAPGWYRTRAHARLAIKCAKMKLKICKGSTI